MVRVTVDYGYDVHSVSISESAFAKIQMGQFVVVEGQGFPVEGVMERDLWTFNYCGVGAVHVMTDEGREVFDGDLGDTEVAVHHIPNTPQ